MKFSIKKEEAINIISEYNSILKENPVKPILAGLFIEAKNNIITFKGINNEVELIRYFHSDIEEEGSVLIKSALLLEYIKLVDEEFINFEKKDGFLIVNHAEFSILDETLYPEVLEISTLVVAKENSQKLAKLFEKVKFLSSVNSTDMLFNSIKMIFANNSMELVSTDSYRLIYLKEKIETTLERDILIPLETVNIIHKLLKEIDEEVSLSMNENKLIILWKDAYFSCKLLSLNFPDFRALLNNFSYDKTFEFNRDELNSSLRKVISVTKASQDSKNVATFDFKGNKLGISGFSSNAKIKQKVNMIKTGEDLKLGINCKYLKDFTDNLEKNPIFYATSTTSMIKITEENNENYLYLLMPVNIRS